MTPEQFPLLQAGARNSERFAEAIEVITVGVEAGAIRNTVLNDAKFVLSNAASNGWSYHVADPFFHARRFEAQPKEVQDLYWDISISNLHEVLATNRKLLKNTAQGPAVDAMRAFVAEVLPLAEAVADLKSKIVKGRAPSTAPSAPVNPNKVIKTCACCFRPIAVQSRTMAHHGYQRPGTGWQTSSCPGIRFRPLEASNEGLVWLIGAMRNRLDFAEKAYKHRDEKTSLSRVVGRAKKVEWTKDSPEWAQEFRRFVRDLEAEISSIKYTLENLDKRLSEWKPESQDQAQTETTDPENVPSF